MARDGNGGSVPIHSEDPPVFGGASPAPQPLTLPAVEPRVPTPPPAPGGSAARRVPRIAGMALAVLLGLAVVGLAGAGLAASRGGRYEELPPAGGSASVSPGPSPTAGGAEDAVRIERLAARLAALRPRGVWVLVDTHANRLRVYRDVELLREAVCSTGSGTVLRDPRTGRLWIFETPLGERRVERKVRNPVWSKPDWAFIEDGYLPPRDASERVDSVSLGDYALYLGDGYLIHGTLFQTLLGRRVTHGCIRLGDEDLLYVYRTVPVGARVFLF